MRAAKHGMTFVNGLIVVTPIIVTCYIVGAALWWLDVRLRQALGYVLGTSYPGLGIGVGMVGIYAVGLLTRTWLFRMLMRTGEKVLARIPLVKSLYSAIRDLLQFLGGSDSESRGRPAILSLRNGAAKMLCIRTQQRARSFMQDDEDLVPVYLPMSFQIGGFTLYVPRETVQEIEGMTVEELLKLAMTAGIGTMEAAKGPQNGSGAPQGPPPEDGQRQFSGNT
jgi:uncharacterized membrane protein